MGIEMDPKTIKSQPEIYGWDDGRIYFWDGKKETCVNDYPELLRRITKLCRRYFASRKAPDSKTKSQSKNRGSKKKRA